jgi:hypothetical protein
MGDFEPLMVYDLIIIEQDVKINVARSFVDGLLSTKSILNTLKFIQECERLEGSFHLVEVSCCHVIES